LLLEGDGGGLKRVIFPVLRNFFTIPESSVIKLFGFCSLSLFAAFRPTSSTLAVVAATGRAQTQNFHAEIIIKICMGGQKEETLCTHLVI
jgi:hypothetical protein